MMNFKGYVADDITSVFVDINEFASERTINGVTVQVVEDDDELEYRIKNDYNGLVIGDVLFYISAEEYAKIPNVKAIPTAYQAIKFDGEPMTIINVSEDMGIYEVICRKVG